MEDIGKDGAVTLRVYPHCMSGGIECLIPDFVFEKYEFVDGLWELTDAWESPDAHPGTIHIP